MTTKTQGKISVVIGMAAMIYGVSVCSLPAAYIVGGLLLVAGGTLAYLEGARGKR